MISNNAPKYWEEGKSYLKNLDPKMAELINLFEYPSLKTKDDIFMTLIRSVVGQQISVKAADTVWNRLLEKVTQITPSIITSKDNLELHSCGLSHRKVEYIKEISKIWINEYHSVDWNELTNDLVIEKLTKIRGVGIWTAEMILIFTLLKPDIFPMGDIGAIRAIEKIYNSGEKMDKSEIIELTDKWAPWRTIATWYLWRSIDPEPVQY